MNTLWMKFAEDTSLPDALSEDDILRLNAIFDLQNMNSPWSKAITLLGYKLNNSFTQSIQWLHRTPYINWNLMVSLVSNDALEVIHLDNNNYSVKKKRGFRALLSLLTSQWKTEAFLREQLDNNKPLAETSEDQITHSLAFGLALLALTLRLPKHTEQELAQWLSNPASTPTAARRTIEIMKQIQHQRTKLTPAWQALFPTHSSPVTHQDLPAFFWNEPPDIKEQKISTALSNQTQWQGRPVCIGNVTGQAVLVNDLSEPPHTRDVTGAIILVFSKAKPETTIYFEQAHGLLFGHGGALSHACTVAREQNIPCITGLGQEFIDMLEQATTPVTLSMNGEDGTILIT